MITTRTAFPPANRSAFVERKAQNDLYKKFNHYFMNRRHVVIYVWRTVDALRQNARFDPPIHTGAYVDYPYRTNAGLFGELHFVTSQLSPDYVAHEVAHFVVDLTATYIDADNASERIAQIAEALTADIWERLGMG